MRAGRRWEQSRAGPVVVTALIFTLRVSHGRVGMDPMSRAGHLGG